MKRSLPAAAPAAPTIPSIPRTHVLPRLAALRTAPIAEPKQQWRTLYGKEPPAFSRSYIESRLAYRIQELEPPRVCRRLQLPNRMGPL
ncbi:MAG: DUF2924 domain-containing protein [Roseomonas sp.]|nr:DUF2924 domain-containing protein [Roseomonas sp.]MCA3306938.1 DUF2924 domain-containing protein [Roseomonas sp.]